MRDTAAALPILEVRGLDKSFGGIHVTRHIDLALAPGERRVILGPNGAGKTTLFNLLVGELRPSAGEILFLGQPITRLSVPARARLGIARSYQKNNLFEELTIRENLALAAAAAVGDTRSFIRDCFHNAEVRAIIDEVAEQVFLTAILDTEVRNASYGNRRQLEVGIALAARPKLLLMDEPTSGVGPGLIEGFNRMMQALPRDLSMVIIEHDMDLAFDVADRITVLNQGEVVFEGAPAETRDNAVVREIYLGDWQGHA
jgi:branched-chain amino acid transport system ATP-binding protein